MNLQSIIGRKKAGKIALAALMALGASSCSWLNEGLEPCPTELRLRFVYDYNMMRSDVFRDHVGAVTAYVFDKEGRLVARQSETDRAALSVYGYEMAFPNLAPGDYTIRAVAFQRSEEEIAQRPGARFRLPDLQPGDNETKLEVKLDRTPGADGINYVENQGEPLDMLWMNLAECRVTQPAYETVTQTVSLMRDTKNLTVSLHQLDDPTDIDCKDYDIRLTDRNGWLNHDNSLHADDAIVYTPYAEWNTEFKDEEGNVAQRTAHADLSFSRLMYYADWKQCARLTITNRNNANIVADINLPDMLAQGRSTGEQPYAPQEFLDREYTYKLDFFLKGDRWEYVDLSISVLSWSVRIQNIGL